MLAGTPERFAIEAVIESSEGRWVLGHFRFWLDGRPVGDWEDFADLWSCISWLRDFERNPRDRHDARLDGLPADQVFRLLWDAIFLDGGSDGREPPIPSPFSRFHISHLGMSAFDRFDLFMVKAADGRERCLWREGDAGPISDVLLAAGEMESVAREFCEAFEREIPWPGEG